MGKFESDNSEKEMIMKQLSKKPTDKKIKVGDTQKIRDWVKKQK